MPSHHTFTFSLTLQTWERPIDFWLDETHLDIEKEYCEFRIVLSLLKHCISMKWVKSLLLVLHTHTLDVFPLQYVCTIEWSIMLRFELLVAFELSCGAMMRRIWVNNTWMYYTSLYLVVSLSLVFGSCCVGLIAFMSFAIFVRGCL